MQPRRQLARLRRRDQTGRVQDDRLICEEPLRVQLESRSSPSQALTLATILRTPGDDFELVRGYLYSLGLIEERGDLLQLSYCSSGRGRIPADPRDYNRVTAVLRGPIPERALRLRSPEWVHGGCGACGQGELETLPSAPVEPFLKPISRAWLHSLPEQLRLVQPLFRHSGGVHAAAVAAHGQGLSWTYEDVGRHNAVDKLIGRLLEENALPASERWLILSGRAGFELVQKAVRAGFSGVASMGPPSSLAWRHAQAASLTLVGFLSARRFNIYCEPAPNRWVD